MTVGLRLERLRTGYARVPIVTDATLRVAPGEIVGLLGANGAGKSTVLRALAGALPAWSGTIYLDEHDLSRARPWTRVRCGLAHVPEGRHVFTAMTVADNLAVAALAARGERRIGLDDVYQLFPRLAERRQQLAGSLSGGEAQMLAIGRALVTNPTILLVDEMSAGLAPIIAQQLVGALVDIHHRGVGILLVEQSPHLIAGAVERVYLLEHGRLVREGTLADLGGPNAIADHYLGVAQPVAS